MSAGRRSPPGPVRAPRLARAILWFCVSAERRDDVIGDLNEMHARRRARAGAVVAWIATSMEAVVVGAGLLFERWKEGGRRTAWLTLPEIRLAFRMARKQPLLNLAALLALATGIGLAAAAFDLVEMTTLARVPFPDGDRFVRVRVADAESGGPAEIHRGRFEALSGESGAFAYVGALADGSANILDEDGAVEAVPGAAVGADVFSVLPYHPLLGRPLLASDGTAGATPVVVLSEGLWRRRYAADPGVVGRTMNLGGTVRQVIGVLPADAGFPNRPDVWVPLVLTDAVGGGALPPAPGDSEDAGPPLSVFGVLREGATLVGAESRMVARSAGWEAAHPGAKRLRVRVRPYTEIAQDGVLRLFLAALLTAVLAVVLVIAANVGNLVAARTAARRSELAVRTALGAARRNLVLQLFGEVMVLGAAAGALAAWGLVRLMSGMALWLGRDIPFWIDMMPGPATWAFLLGVTVLACVVAGVVPALRATRGAPGDALRSAGRGGGAAVFGRTASAVSVLQIAFSVALLGAALLAVRGMQRYADTRPALPADRILVAGTSMARAAGPDAAVAALERVERATAEIPGVQRVGFASFIPGVEAPVTMMELEPEAGEAPEGPRPAPVADVRPGYLEALGTMARLGRLVRREDILEGAPPVAVVNASFVRKFLHGRNPLGRHVRLLPVETTAGPTRDARGWREIVGVVPDMGLSVGDPEMEAGLYVPLTDPGWGYLVLSVTEDPGVVADRLRRTLARVEPNLLVPLVRTLDQAGSENAKTLALFGGILSALGGMALVLSLVSTYALVSFTVSRRVREVGIRVALGASSAAVLRSVAGRAAVQIAAGALIGTPLGLLLVQVKRIFVFRVPSGEPWVLPLVALVMVTAGALASWVPARGALRVGPAEALRTD